CVAPPGGLREAAEDACTGDVHALSAISSGSFLPRTPHEEITIMLRKSAVVRSLIAGASLLLVTELAAAQTGVAWVTFTKLPSKLGPSPLQLSDTDTQASLTAGDLDQDGWVDLVVVRKQPSPGAGKKKAVLLMNVSGVLTDRTSQLATAADVGGDLG